MSKAGDNNKKTGENAGKGGIIPPMKTRFKKGQTGNPNGRPRIPEKVKRARELLQEANERVVNALIETGEYEELLLLGLRNTIAAGKVDGFKFLNDYNNNKPQDKVEHEGEVVTKLIVKFMD